MKQWLINLWKFSKLRFYYLNLIWNYSFWLNAKPYYAHKYFTATKDFLDFDKNLDSLNLKFEFDKKSGNYKKFVGYYYKGSLYLDNPGVQQVDFETKKHWVKKKWI